MNQVRKTMSMAVMLLLCSVAFSTSLFADDGNTLQISNFSATAGSQQTISVNMVNTASITGFQFDLVLPAGVSIAKVDDEPAIDLNTTRTTYKKHSVSCKAQTDGSMRVVCTSMSNAVFSGNSGAVIDITLDFANSMTTGDYTVSVKNIELTTPETTQYKTERSESKISVTGQDGGEGPEANIHFVDPIAKEICIRYWDTNKDGELSYEEAAAVTDLESVFKYSSATSLDELKYFTGLTSIEDCAFSQCSNLTSITIPNSVTSIGTSAFEFCSNLTSVTIGNSVKSIGFGVFWGCSSLASITIPNSVTSIGHRAFQNCSGLTSIIIPNSVTTIEDYAFQNCSSLASVTIGNSVTNIREATFNFCSGLTSIIIPNSVTTIENNAFDGCSGLTSVTIPNSVTSIGNSAFHDCSINELNIIIVDYANNNIIMDHDYFRRITPHYFYNDKKIEGDVAFPDNLKTIGHKALYNCIEVSSITIPNSVASIEWGAFSGCRFTSSEFINNSSLDEVQNNYWGANIYDVIQEDGLCINDDVAVSFRGKSTSVIIPNFVTSIGNYAFKNCSGLTSITIPNSVTSIGEYAFFGCTSLPVENNLRYADTYLIGAVDKTLSTYTIKEGTKWIGDEAFYDCSYLTSITIPNSVTNIGKYAFEGCHSLKTVEIPRSVKNINWWCFLYCDSLSDVTVKWDNPSSVYYNSKLFSNVDLSKATLHVPVGTKALYEAADVWKDFGTIVSNQTLKMNDSRAWAGEQKAIPVYLDNDVTISNVQFDLYLPDGIDLAAEEAEEGEEPEYLIERGGRMKSSHNLSCAKQDEGIYRIICYSTTNATLKDTDKSQPLMTLTLQIPNDIEVGNHDIVMKDVTLAHIDEGITTPYSTNRIEAILSIPHAYSLIVTSDDKTGNATISGKTYDSSSSLAEEGDTITLTANAMPRYRFSKWTDGKQELSTENPYTFILSSDRKITAEFVLDEHNIKFWADGQEFASTIQVRGDKLLVPSTNPTKVGYTFTGWEGVTEETVVPDSDAWYYAMFSPNPYTVTFRSEGNVVSSGIQYCDNWLQLPQAPTKVGYTFVGWEGVTSDTKVPACDVTYDAVFTINQYKVTFMANGQVVSETMQDYMSQITAPEAPEVANHVFITWGDVNTVPANDVTFTARYCLMGDIYEDGIVNITDLTELVNMIMTKDVSDERKVKVADVYKDGIINITDLTSIVNIIMSKQYNVKGRETLSHNNIVGLSVDCNLLKSGTDGLMGINLENGEDEISNMQFDLVLPEGVTMTADDLVASIKATDRLTSSHMISVCQNEDGSFRILIYSFQNATIKGTEGNIVNIAISTDGLMPDGEYDVDIYDASLVRPTSVPVEYDYINGKMYIGQATGINDIDIASRSVENGKMYNTSGQPAGNGYKGIVISNGQKKYNK